MFSTDHEFEDEVRRIARLLWPEAEFDGATIEDGRERDGVFFTTDAVHCVECTTSREKKKAEDTGAKLDKQIKKYTAKEPSRVVKGWFITLNEPTHDQRGALTRYQSQGRLVACSYDQFRSRLIDARAYLDARKEYTFGSVQDPASGSTAYKFNYYPLEVLDSNGQQFDAGMLSQSLAEGDRVVLTGDYGAGKSATAREIFFDLARRFWSGKSALFPLLLNLRDHHGQTDPVEAIERHARRVGFQQPSALVRAWRAGYCIPLLDGFDEIASAGWAGKTKRLRDLRFRSMELVRCFIRETPEKIGFHLGGRAHFFDSDAEMRAALGVENRFRHLKLAELSLERMKQFLGGLGWAHTVPEWLPSRPLLLAYLVGRGLLGDANTAAVTPAVGWHELLDRVADRESEIEAGIDRSTVRRLIERVATLARRSADGLGPIQADSISDAFKEICGYPPDDRGAVLMQRLPGLGTASLDDGSRVMIDSDFAAAAQSGDVFAFIDAPFVTKLDCREWQSCIGPLGAAIVAHRCEVDHVDRGKIAAAFVAARDRQTSHNLAADILLAVMQVEGMELPPSAFLKEVVIPSINFEDQTLVLGAIEFQNAIIGDLVLPSDVKAADIPRFVACHFGNVTGRTGTADLPLERFVDCTFEQFETDANTTSSILRLQLPTSTRVMLTLLKKLFAQAGRGRMESALFRGLAPREVEVVPSAIDLLRQNGFITRSRHGTVTVWLPARTPDVRRRALAMLAAPNSSRDQLLLESMNL